jgi:glycosyltransferase involved in cell wall biosynthesis
MDVTMLHNVSVIIPTYNAGMCIEQAINSVLTQRYKANIEIIVIDDGSTDNTRALVSEMSMHHKQIIYVTNVRQKGPSGARNTGLLRATGEYIAFLDADDVWLPNHLETGINFLEANNDIDVVFMNFKISDLETKREISDWFTQRHFSQRLRLETFEDDYHVICDDMFNALLDECFIHLQSMVIKSKMLRGILFNENIKHSEDRDFCIKLHLISHARFSFKDTITGIYYRHSKSLSYGSLTNELDTALDHIMLYSEYLSDHSLDKCIKVKLTHLLYKHTLSCAFYYRKLNNRGMSLKLLLDSFKYKVTFYQAKEFIKLIISLIFRPHTLHKHAPL